MADQRGPTLADVPGDLRPSVLSLIVQLDSLVESFGLLVHETASPAERRAFVRAGRAARRFRASIQDLWDILPKRGG